jgi:Gluconate 2-dehydrogenase subunit 3
MSTARRLKPIHQTHAEPEPFVSRYPHFNVLDKWATPDWDDQTRDVIRARLEDVPPIRFFTATEAATLTAVVDRMLPQPDRDPSARVPIVPWIDKKLFDDQRDGFREETLPPQRQAWKLALAAIDESARSFYRVRFADIDEASQDMILKRVQQGDPPGETWKQVPPKPFFSKMLMYSVLHIYYAHPAAWNEIGYHGPSSPRGYSRIWDGGLDPWDAVAEGNGDAA